MHNSNIKFWIMTTHELFQNIFSFTNSAKQNFINITGGYI